MTQLYLFENDYPYKRTKNPLVPAPSLEVSEVTLSYKSKVKPEDRPKVTCSQDAANVFLNAWDKDDLGVRESVYVLYLNQANRGVGMYRASVGGIAATVVQPQHVAVTGYLLNASALIIAHNHPSGNPEPSAADIAMTKNISDVCKSAGMKLMDHVLVTGPKPDNYISFADKGMMV